MTFRTGSGTVPAVSDLTFDLARGEILALLGESGSGKSATARAIMGLLRPPTATVRADRLRLDTADLLEISETEARALRGSRMSLVFQDALSALNPVFTIGTQLSELFRLHGGTSRAEARRASLDLLRLVGIAAPEQRIDDYPHQLSGGMRQRVLIAMAIALRPRLLIADEPTTALDVTVQAQILELLDRLRRELGMAILLITHDLGVVAEIADRVAVMYAGRIVETAPVEPLFAAPAHPYTEALLTSTPRGDAALRAIPGVPANPAALPGGCAFHTRCAYAQPLCAAERPALRERGPNATVACHFPRAMEAGHA
ncbi:MAG TPA: ABC transporter ATP-binding protein [Aliidongia sp.]|nr:ABC transporter ATP-binding protein [Aliidongia sp.]